MDFPLHGKNGLKISTKLVVKKIMFDTVQGEYSAVIALKFFATESCIQLIWHDNGTKTVQNHA